MSKAKLIFDLIRYVNTKRCFTAQDVAYELGISVRTAHRYLTEISEMGVPIYTEQGRNGGYRVLKNRMLPPVSFDENEALSIFFAFQALKYYNSLPFDANIASVSRKLHSSLPEDTKNKINRLEEVLSFWNPKRSVASPYLKEIIEASIENNVLIVEYMSKTTSRKREIKPVGVYAYDGLWYMPGYDVGSEKVQLFRVDRILSMEKSDVTLELKMSLADWLANDTVEAPVRLFAELTREGIRQCKGVPWLEPHIVITGEDIGYVDTIIDKKELEYVSDYFGRLGTCTKVIEPPEIVENILKRARSLMEHYS